MRRSVALIKPLSNTELDRGKSHQKAINLGGLRPYLRFLKAQKDQASRATLLGSVTRLSGPNQQSWDVTHADALPLEFAALRKGRQEIRLLSSSLSSMFRMSDLKDSPTSGRPPVLLVAGHERRVAQGATTSLNRRKKSRRHLDLLRLVILDNGAQDLITDEDERLSAGGHLLAPEQVSHLSDNLVEIIERGQYARTKWFWQDDLFALHRHEAFVDFKSLDRATLVKEAWGLTRAIPTYDERLLAATDLVSAYQFHAFDINLRQALHAGAHSLGRANAARQELESLSQAMKSTWGKVFELMVEEMLSHAKLRFKTQSRQHTDKENAIPDFTIFSPSTGKVIGQVSAKTATRERWRQVEGMKGDHPKILLTLERHDDQKLKETRAARTALVRPFSTTPAVKATDFFPAGRALTVQEMMDLFKAIP